MPLKKRRSKKRKGKKKKNKQRIEMHPPPLHELTRLYDTLLQKVKHLNQIRLIAREKRLEAWYISREAIDVKNDNQIYRNYLEENIDELEEIIVKIMETLEREREALRKEIQRLTALLEKKHEGILKRIEEVHLEMIRVKEELRQYEPLMAKLAELLQRLRELEKEIEAAELEADIKTRHFKNQFLCERAKLHNILETKLFELINNCRSYVMPILAGHMHRQQHINFGYRSQLIEADTKHVHLLERRDDLAMKLRLLKIEKPYMHIEWAFEKLSELQGARRQRRTEIGVRSPTVTPPPTPTELAAAFAAVLKRRLQAYRRNQGRLKTSSGGQKALEVETFQLGYTEILGEASEMTEKTEYQGEDGEGYSVELIHSLSPYGRIAKAIRKKKYSQETKDDSSETSESNASIATGTRKVA